MDDQDRINASRLMDYIKKRVLENFGKSSDGWDPDEAYEILSRTVKETIPEDSPVTIKTPTREKFIALRLMGEDIKNCLRFEVEFKPPVVREFIDIKFRIGDKTE
jgi:hypothetical protein